MSSIFLAIVMGWYLVIFSLFLLCRQKVVRAFISEVLTERSAVLILAIITVIIGLLLVASHNIWIMDWPVAITILSWFILLSGIFRLWFPDMAIELGEKANTPVCLNITGIVLLIIGLFLLYYAYY